MGMWALRWAEAGGQAPSAPLGLDDPLAVLHGRWLAFVAYLPRIAIALLVILAAVWISRIIGRLEKPYRKLAVNPLAQSLLQQTVRVAVLCGGLLLALDVLKATALVGAVLGTAGVVGLAIGFAFKDIVENYIAGVLLSLRQPFAHLDYVDVGGHKGKVMRLTSRATILMTLDGNHLRLPNSLVFKSVITNYTRSPRRRFDFSVGVGVDEDLIAAQDLGLQILRAMDGVLDDPGPSAEILELGDSNISLRFYAWIDQRTHGFSKVRSEAVRRVKTAFDDAEIEMPEPIYRVMVTERSSAAGFGEPKAPRRRAGIGEAAPDLTVDNTLDQQIEEERAADSPPDLLSNEAPKE